MSQVKWNRTHGEIARAIARYGPILSSSHKSLLQTLATYGNPDGKNIFVSVKTLAEREGHQVRWTQYMLRDLGREGFIASVDKKGGKGRFAQYEICLAKLGIGEAAPPEVAESANNVSRESTIIPPHVLLPQKPQIVNDAATENVFHWQEVIQREQFGLDEALKRGDEVYAARRREKLAQAKEQLAIAESEKQNESISTNYERFTRR